MIHSIISPRRYISENLSAFGAEEVIDENSDPSNVIGVRYHDIEVSTLQGPMANEAWLDQTTDTLISLCQPNVHSTVSESLTATESSNSSTTTTTLTHRRLHAPEICFSHAIVSVTLLPYKASLTWTCLDALKSWSEAHASIPMGAKHMESTDILGAGQNNNNNGVSILQTVDAELWSHKTSQYIAPTEFHFDWTYSTPFSVSLNTATLSSHQITTPLPRWKELSQSPLNLALLQDKSQPILYYDDIELYEDDLHDNGIVNFSVKIRLMTKCLYILSRLWCRVDGAWLRCRETRIFVEWSNDHFNSNCTKKDTHSNTKHATATSLSQPCHPRVVREITWRECAWKDLAKYHLPTDVRVWKNEGTNNAEDAAKWNTLVNRLPQIPLPNGMHRYSVLERFE
jgi:TIP41-like family